MICILGFISLGFTYSRYEETPTWNYAKAAEIFIGPMQLIEPEAEQLNIVQGIYLVANNFIDVSQIPVPQEPKQIPNIKGGIGNGWCVAYVKYITKAPYSGDAWEWAKYINASEPSPGDIVVLNENKLGHVAVVISVSENTFTISEQNYKGRYVISKRTLDKTYSAIQGFIHGF